MIVFDLDGTLANCEHRRHFVDDSPTVIPRYEFERNITSFPISPKNEPIKFKPNWRAFYDACDGDSPIHATLGTFKMLYACDAPIQIWSGRCESVRDKTIKWLSYHLTFTMNWGNGRWHDYLKMRPIGDNTPDDQLKERWLDQWLFDAGNRIDFVFDDRPKVVRMWRRRGIFVFDCSQDGKEF